jgi:hypothetical protein
MPGKNEFEFRSKNGSAEDQ